MRQLIAFYKSPAGTKSIRVMPQVLAEVNAWIMEQTMGLMTRLREHMRPMIEKAVERSRKQTG